MKFSYTMKFFTLTTEQRLIADTLAVIALDAADHALLKQWDCKNILLDRHAELETFTGTHDIPITTEVWPTVATGLPPEKHGLVADGEQQSWGNPILDAASVVSSKVLPASLRASAGEFVQKFRGNDRGATSRPRIHQLIALYKSPVHEANDDQLTSET
jgi:hypothetical protein